MTAREGIAPRLRALFAMSSLSICIGCGGGTGSDADSPGHGGGVPDSSASSGGGTSDGDSPNSNDDAGAQSSEDGGSGSMPPPGDGQDGAVVDSGPKNGGGVPEGGPLDPNVAPGGNFDLAMWELTEPIASASSPTTPTTISPAKLVGANGYHDSYFFTDPTDGSMTFWDPENGVATSNSDYPRSELREMTLAGSEANWPSSGTNTLSATLKVTQVPNHVAVGQIHLGTGTPASTKPLLELFYYDSGSIVLSIEQTPAGDDSMPNPVGNVPLGKVWSYVIGLSGNTISLVINGGSTQTFTMSSTFDQENMYFKAGDYDQSSGSSATVGAQVQFYALSLFHGP
jgi:hypothetical protein